MGSNPKTNISGQQVLQKVYDETQDRLRVDASVTATIGDMVINANESDIAIEDRVSGNQLKINADGSIDANVILDAAGGDNVKISDGTDTLAINPDGSITSVVTQSNHDNLNVNANLQVNNTDVSSLNPLPITDSGSSITVDAVDLDIRDISHLQDSIKIGDGTDFLSINADGSINTTGTISLPTNAATESKQDVANTSLASILTSVDGLESGQLTSNTILASIADNTDLIESKLDDVITAVNNQEPMQVSGTENGQTGGIERVFVNNVRLQILSAKDKQQHISYADFGTKDQRITAVTYTAPSIGSGAGYTATKTISYTLVGNRYRRDDINWTLV